MGAADSGKGWHLRHQLSLCGSVYHLQK